MNVFLSIVSIQIVKNTLVAIDDTGMALGDCILLTDIVRGSKTRPKVNVIRSTRFIDVIKDLVQMK